MARVYVGNLNPNTAKHQLESEFSRFGSLQDVWIARNPPGFAFIEFQDKRDAEDAVADLNGRDIDGRSIRVEISTSRGGGGGRGGRGGGGFRGGGGYGGGYGGGGRYEDRRSSYDDRRRDDRYDDRRGRDDRDSRYDDRERRGSRSRSRSRSPDRDDRRRRDSRSRSPDRDDRRRGGSRSRSPDGRRGDDRDGRD